MYKSSLHTYHLLFIQIFYIFALEPNLSKLTKEYGTESARWPLQVGYPGLQIKNLNEYVSLFSHCLVNIQNYQGIEILGIKSPVYITRFDVAYSKFCRYYFGQTEMSSRTRRFYFGKIAPKLKRDCKSIYSQEIKYTDKSMNARWTCSAQFDLFYPEPYDAPQIVRNSQAEVEMSLFDVAYEYRKDYIKQREDWSELL